VVTLLTISKLQDQEKLAKLKGQTNPNPQDKKQNDVVPPKK
jgi:hypothetical protein